MNESVSRRDALKTLGAASAGLMLGGGGGGVIRGLTADIMIAGKPVEIEVRSVSAATVRVIIRPIEGGKAAELPYTGALVAEDVGRAVKQGRATNDLSRVRAGDLVVRFTDGPPTLHVETSSGKPVQQLVLDASGPGMTFLLPKGPLLGLGEGGAQFDRKGTVDTMRIGQGASQPEPRGYQLGTHGTRAPIQWLVGTDGWAMFIHQPAGAFDFTGTTGKYTPKGTTALPLDLFVVASQDPQVIMREYARITGLPELPARWTLGYQQSHRTLEGADAILAEARTFREKKLPCEAMIYLGTDFAPSGWNTHNGEFTWHPTNFPDPQGMVAKLHDEHFKVILHIVIEGRHLTGTVHDPCTAPELPPGRTPDGRWPPDRQVSCYWPAHKPLMDVGVDGWWPDQGDGFDGPSELNRHRMYWEGSQLYRPNERPFSLHRNASAGVQRFGGFIWSGDVRALWATLKNHVPDAVNTGLSGLPYWGTDIGGFNPTPEYTGELHIRWFQFGAFCPVFRAHGRNWHLKLPWGWDGGDGGPFESGNFRIPPEELHNKQVEPILRKYLELRYRLLPYSYSAMRDTHDTGMPMMRAMWLHYPTEPEAVARGDQYLWGRDMLVAPVVEKGATSRKLYLPKGTWVDFWTEKPVAGGREIERDVDLATTPLYVRSGAVIPMGPVKQYSEEPSDEPLTLVVYPGADGSSSWYEDDGKSFEYRTGAWMRVSANWNDVRRTLSLALAPGSRMLPPSPRPIAVRLAGSDKTTHVTFTGRPLQVKL